MSFDFSKEIEKCATISANWEKMDNKSVLITGATGLVGKFIIEVLLKRNELFNLDTKIYAVGRNREKFNNRFADVKNFELINFIEHDVQKPFEWNKHLDYIIHMASNTHPRQYASDPIGTELSNILGTYNLLNLASNNQNCRFVFASSGDVYGDNRSGLPFFKETDCGYIDCNTLRAGYIEGKRASEALCNAYKEANNVDFVIARLCRIYGPTMQLTDSKAISQFILNAVNGEDVILKSKGEQIFSYLYIYDVVTAMFMIILNGENGNAYNVADNTQTVSLKKLAELLADIGKSKVIYKLPDEVEKKGASTFNDVRLDAGKLYSLGWKSEVQLMDGLRNTVNRLQNVKEGFIDYGK